MTTAGNGGLQPQDLKNLSSFRETIDRMMGAADNGSQPIRRVPLPGSGGYKGGAACNGALVSGNGIKVHHGVHGPVYELAAGAKCADVIGTKEAPEISLERWLAAAVLGDACEDKTALQFASEAKSLSTGVTGTLIPQGFQGQWIDNLRSNMVLEACGMTTATMGAGTVTSSRVVSDPPVGWRAEGAALNAGDPTFELRQLVAKSLAVRVQATAELSQDSPDFGSQLLQVMSKALALECDRVGLIGTGTSNQPQGIFNTSGINSVTGVGAAVYGGYSHFVTGLQRLLEANVPLEQAQKNAIMSPRTWASYESLMDGNGQPLGRPRALDRMEFRPTTSIPNNLGAGSNESIAIMGDFRDLVMGVRMEATVEALRLQTYATNLLVEFVGWTRVDFMVRRPASFVVLEGLTVP